MVRSSGVEGLLDVLEGDERWDESRFCDDVLWFVILGIGLSVGIGEFKFIMDDMVLDEVWLILDGSGMRDEGEWLFFLEGIRGVEKSEGVVEEVWLDRVVRSFCVSVWEGFWYGMFML